MKKAIFVDKDGTLVVNIPFNADPKKIKLLPYSAKSLMDLRNEGFEIIVISNQSGIANGLFSEKELQKIKKELEKKLRFFDVDLKAFYYCPHHPKGTIPKYTVSCCCRKPSPGLLKKAAIEHGINLKKSWMIGDILNDIEAGNRAGCKTILLNTGNETEWRRTKLRKPDFEVTSWKEVASRILLEESLLKSEKYLNNLSSLLKILNKEKSKGKKIVFTNGCFDILHSGHVFSLNLAKSLGDLLVVGINTDESVKKNKGDNRPINCFTDRALVLSGLKSVDYIIPFSEYTPVNLIKLLEPDIYVKGGDYKKEDLPETSIVEEYGGVVKILPYIKKHSTTEMIKKLNE